MRRRKERSTLWTRIFRTRHTHYTMSGLTKNRCRTKPAPSCPSSTSHIMKDYWDCSDTILTGSRLLVVHTIAWETTTGCA